MAVGRILKPVKIQQKTVLVMKTLSTERKKEQIAINKKATIACKEENARP